VHIRPPTCPHDPVLAGAGARMLPVWMHQSAEEQRLRASDAEIEQLLSMGMGPLDAGTEEQEVRG